MPHPTASTSQSNAFAALAPSIDDDRNQDPEHVANVQFFTNVLKEKDRQGYALLFVPEDKTTETFLSMIKSALRQAANSKDRDDNDETVMVSPTMSFKATEYLVFKPKYYSYATWTLKGKAVDAQDDEKSMGRLVLLKQEAMLCILDSALDEGETLSRIQVAVERAAAANPSARSTPAAGLAGWMSYVLGKFGAGGEASGKGMAEAYVWNGNSVVGEWELVE